MQATSGLYRQLIASDNHWFETMVRIAGYSFSESALMSVSTESAMFGGNPEVGRAIAGETDVCMTKPSVAIPRMAKVEPFVRVCGKTFTAPDIPFENGILDLENVASLENDIANLGDSAKLVDDVVYFQKKYTDVKSEWLPMGVYYIDTRETTKNFDGLDLLILHGYDAMLFAEQMYPATEHDWPMSDVQVVAEIASTMGVEVDPRTWDVMTSGYEISLPASYTMREALGYIAAMYVGSFIMTETGKLRLVTMLELPAETSYLIDAGGFAITFGGDRILV